MKIFVAFWTLRHYNGREGGDRFSVGSLLKDRRLELGLTLEQVGNAVGVGKSTVRKWENGMIANMKRDKIVLLARILQISPTDLINYDTPEEFTNEEIHFIKIYRNAEEAYHQIAVEILENHQKQKTPSQ